MERIQDNCACQRKREERIGCGVRGKGREEEGNRRGEDKGKERGDEEAKE